MTDAFAAYGSQLQRGNGADPEVFSPVAEITSDIPTSLQRPSIDVTSHGSGGVRSRIPGGIRSFEPIQITCNLVRDAVEADIRADFDSGARTNYRVIDPDGEGLEFEAVVTNISTARALDGALQANITFDPTGLFSVIEDV